MLLRSGHAPQEVRARGGARGARGRRWMAGRPNSHGMFISALVYVYLFLRLGLFVHTSLYETVWADLLRIVRRRMARCLNPDGER